eukprot:g3686.t1
MVSISSSRSSATIRSGSLQDVNVITDYNMRLAYETENIQLNKSAVLEGVKTALSNPAYGVYYLVEIDQQVIGQLRVEYQWLPFHSQFTHWIQSVYIHPDHRRKGYYRMLYKHTRNEALKQGALAVSLYADDDNEKAKQTYRNLGMSEVSRVYGMGNLP